MVDQQNGFKAWAVIQSVASFVVISTLAGIVTLGIGLRDDSRDHSAAIERQDDRLKELKLFGTNRDIYTTGMGNIDRSAAASSDAVIRREIDRVQDEIGTIKSVTEKIKIRLRGIEANLKKWVERIERNTGIVDRNRESRHSHGDIEDANQQIHRIYRN